MDLWRPQLWCDSRLDVKKKNIFISEMSKLPFKLLNAGNENDPAGFVREEGRGWGGVCTPPMVWYWTDKQLRVQERKGCGRLIKTQHKETNRGGLNLGGDRLQDNEIGDLSQFSWSGLIFHSFNHLRFYCFMHLTCKLIVILVFYLVFAACSFWICLLEVKGFID